MTRSTTTTAAAAFVVVVPECSGRDNLCRGP